jgi:hypothetical protein
MVCFKGHRPWSMEQSLCLGLRRRQSRSREPLGFDDLLAGQQRPRIASKALDEGFTAGQDLALRPDIVKIA